MNDEFDDIIDENFLIPPAEDYEYVHPARDNYMPMSSDGGISDEEVARIALELWEEQKMANTKASTTDALLVLILLVGAIGLLVWSVLDLNWTQIRPVGLIGGLFLLTVAIKYSSKIGAKNGR